MYVRALLLCFVFLFPNKTYLGALREDDVVVAVDVQAPPSATFTVKIEDDRGDVFLLSKRYVPLSPLLLVLVLVLQLLVLFLVAALVAVLVFFRASVVPVFSIRHLFQTDLSFQIVAEWMYM